jgi:hypothetical protein
MKLLLLLLLLNASVLGPQQPVSTCPSPVACCAAIILVLPLAVKIGRPGYRVTKQYDPDTRQRSLLFQVCVFVSRGCAGGGWRCVLRPRVCFGRGYRSAPSKAAVVWRL